MLHVPELVVSFWACSIAYFDARFRRIPNHLSLGAWLLGGFIMLLTRQSLLGAASSSALTAAGFAMLVTLPGYLLKKLGAGDVKFLVAIGLLTSLEVTLTTFVVAALAAGGIALVWLNLPGLAAALPERPPVVRLRAAMLRQGARGNKLPYGPFLAAGLLTSLWIR